MDSSSLPGTTPSVGELSAEFAKQKQAKSPPLAFEKTSNDSLAPLTSPSSQTAPVADTASSLSQIMGRLSPPHLGEEQDLQVVVDQQAAALQLLHDAFAAERQAWSLEKERLYYRIASLEKLLKTGDGYSPAKSPILSPLNTNNNIVSPQTRSAVHTSRLPSIAEDEPTQTLSQRRDQGRQSIDLPAPASDQHHKEAAVGFKSDSQTPTAVMVQEIAVSPPPEVLSPPPFYNRMQAGHTPLRAPRPLTPPPKDSLPMDGIDDTPTQINTQSNARSSEDDEDVELTGPLNMPELPNKPDETNFTLEALSKRLERIEKHPDESTPSVVSDRSPARASPPAEPSDLDQAETAVEENPIAPAPTHKAASSTLSAAALSPPSNAISSNALSPTGAATLSPLSKHASRDEQEDKVQQEFENGGIRLKKKPSSNFGAPWGQLAGGFGRRVSHDWQ